MKLEVLGLNHWLFFSATCQTVRPPSLALSSGHLRIPPPQDSNWIPRFLPYHSASFLWSPVDLKNTPPIPVTLAMREVFHTIRSLRMRTVPRHHLQHRR